MFLRFFNHIAQSNYYCFVQNKILTTLLLKKALKEKIVATLLKVH